MSIPLEDVEPGQLQADVCIIGSGPSGQAVARALSGSDLDVLVVEAGDVEAGRWGRRFASAVMPSRGRQYPNAGHQVTIRAGGTSDRWAIRIDPATAPVAGTGARLGRFDRVDLEPRATTGGPGWPITIDDLEPHYRAAEEMFGLDPCRRSELDSPLDDRNVAARVFWVADRVAFTNPDLGDVRLISRCPVRSLSVDRSGRIAKATAVTWAGSTVDIHADVFVLAAGTVQTTRLLLESPWSGAGSVANSSGLVGRLLTDHPQLVIGQLVVDRSADLSLLEPLAPSVEPGPSLRWPNLVTSPERSRDGDVARLAVALFPVERLPRAQAIRNRIPRPLGARTGAMNAMAALRDAVAERSIDRATLRRIPAVIGGLDELVAAAATTRSSSASWEVESPHWADRGNLDAVVGFQIFAVAEQLPDPDNRIVLSAERNAIGARRPRIEWRWSADDIRRAEAAAEDMRAALSSIGVGEVLPRRGRAAVHKINSHHPAGTTRMSTAPQTGVVDPDLRTHDHHNLYIVGGSVFTTGGFVNPTLTDVALGLRLGQRLRSL